MAAPDLTPDFRLLFEAAPSACLVVAPDEPVFTIIAVSDAYLRATLTRHEQLVGQHLFDAFPDNPAVPGANGVRHLRASLERVLAMRAADEMAVQQYDIRRPDGSFEERHWSVVNTPALDAEGRVVSIIHRVEDVTELVHLRALKAAQAELAAQNRRDSEQAREALRASEERLRLFVENVRDYAFVLTDHAGRVTGWNSGAERILGWREAEILGQPVALFFTDEDRAAGIPEGEMATAEREGCATDERWHQRRDGACFFAIGVMTSVRDEAGSLVGFAKVLRDETKRHQAEAALRESEDHYRHMVELNPEVPWTATSDGLIESFSHRWLEVTGLTHEQALGEGWMQVLPHPEDQGHMAAAWVDSMSTGRPYDSEARLRMADGNYRWWRARAYPRRDEGGRIVRWYGTTEDIHDRKRVEEEVRARNRDLEEFAYVASHDLQEPLRMVHAYTQLLLRQFGGENSEAQQYAGFIKKGVSRMEELIRDLLTFSRTIHAEDLPIGTAHLQDSLTEALTVLRGRIKESGATVTAEALPAVRGEVRQLALVFQNLLSNSLKYCKADVPPAIHISAERENDGWIVAVRDNGIGFDQRYAERIFGLFKRLHKDEYPGTGLGLAICQRIIERYGGRTWAEGQLGKGATFYFVLRGAEEQ